MADTDVMDVIGRIKLQNDILETTGELNEINTALELPLELLNKLAKDAQDFPTLQHNASPVEEASQILFGIAQELSKIKEKYPVLFDIQQLKLLVDEKMVSKNFFSDFETVFVNLVCNLDAIKETCLLLIEKGIIPKKFKTKEDAKAAVSAIEI